MIPLPAIPELSFWGIYERGLPRKERIVFKPNVSVNLLNFAVVLGVQEANGAFRPHYDSVYFFQDQIIEPPAWVFIYTGQGTPTITVENTTKEPVHSVFWQRDRTVFHDPKMSAAIFKLGGIEIAPAEGVKIDLRGLQQLLKLK